MCRINGCSRVLDFVWFGSFKKFNIKAYKTLKIYIKLLKA